MYELLPRIYGQPAGEPYFSLIEEYLLGLYQKGYSESTIRMYGWNLHKLGKWLLNHDCNPDETTRKTLLLWGVELRGRYQPQTQKQAISAAKSFFLWLVEMEICSKNPVRTLQIPKVKTTLQRTLKPIEVKEILEVCQIDTVKGLRDRAIISILLDTGLRANELCSLILSEVDMERNRCRVVGKGGETETVYYGQRCKENLLDWLVVRESQPGVDEVFVSLGGYMPGTKLTPRGLRIIVKKLGEDANVFDVCPHAFRRSFATIRIKLGQSTRGVQILGRWSDLKTFERYTKAIQDDDDFSVEGAEDFSPLNML